MRTIQLRTTTLLAAGLIALGVPASAQWNGRRADGDRAGREAPRAVPRVERSAPRDDHEPRTVEGRDFRPRGDLYRRDVPAFRARTYVIPYGYRPYGYRPGWSLNLYFGRPSYAYPGYGYAPRVYGYYSIVPGVAYGSVRIVDAPREAQVFVDGYYAGIVDDFDGVFQRLNLEVGPHHIEIEEPGEPPVAFDVHIEPGRTITLHAYLP